MWFQPKPKNRRLERGNVLDVKLRTKEVRRARLRLASAAAGLLLATVTGLYLLWRAGDWALDRFVFENDAFAIRELDIQTDGSIPLEQLRKWAGVKPGVGIGLVSYYLDESGHAVQPAPARVDVAAQNADALPVLAGARAAELTP